MKHPVRPPGYWMDETGSGGMLRESMIRLIVGEELSPHHIRYIRAYLRQWIMSDLWDTNPEIDPDGVAELARLRAGVDGLTSRAAIHEWLMQAMAFGIDPL
jgi:hypothetical protein